MDKIANKIPIKIVLTKEDSWSEPKEPQFLFTNPMNSYYERCKEMKVIEEDGMKKIYSRKQKHYMKHSKAHQCSWIIKN